MVASPDCMQMQRHIRAEEQPGENLSRYMDRAAHIALSVEYTPVVAPPEDTVSVPAIPSAELRLFFWNLLAQLSSLVSLQYSWLAGRFASLARRIA